MFERMLFIKMNLINLKQTHPKCISSLKNLIINSRKGKEKQFQSRTTNQLLIKLKPS